MNTAIINKIKNILNTNTSIKLVFEWEGNFYDIHINDNNHVESCVISDCPIYFEYIDSSLKHILLSNDEIYEVIKLIKGENDMKWLFKIHDSNEQTHIYYNVNKVNMMLIIEEMKEKHPYDFSVELNPKEFKIQDFIYYGTRIKNQFDSWVTYQLDDNMTLTIN